MNITIEKSDLQNICLMATRAVPSKSPITAMEGLMFEAVDGRLTVTGYDLKRAIYTSVEADIAETGKMLINARFFNDLLRRLQDGIVSIICNERDNRISIRCGKSEYQLSGLDTGEYPEVQKFSENQTLEIPQDVLGNMIRRSIFAVAKEETRPVYTGTLFEIEGDELTLVSVDGYRLARRVEKVERSRLENSRFIVPGFALSDVEKFCGDTEEPVIISIGDKHISFTIGNTVIMSRRLEGDFLNHRTAVPENFRFTVKVDRQEMISVIDRVSLVLNDKIGSPVRMIFGDDRIDCRCATPMGRAEDVCTSSGSGDGLEIGFNDKYLMDALKAAESDEVLFCLNTSSSPCIIKDAEGKENYTYMVLPVRIHA